MKLIYLILLFLTSLVFCSDGLARSTSTIKNVKCSPIVEGIEFCTSSQSFIYRLGENISLRLYLVNTTSEEKLLKSVTEFSIPNGWYPPYEDTLTNEKGNKVTTFLDILKQKVVDKTITKEESDELFLRCCFNVGSRWGNSLRLAPYQKLDLDYDLSYKYHFETKGIYFVEIQRNLITQITKPIKAENLVKIPLEQIKIEIK